MKSKTAHGAPAKDLYTSDYFAKMRSYAETSGRPWFILSAEHGLVGPDEWLEPYDCYLPNTSREYRRSVGTQGGSPAGAGWTATAESILEKVTRARTTLQQVVSQ